jgi:hypothetical protein
MRRAAALIATVLLSGGCGFLPRMATPVPATASPSVTPTAAPTTPSLAPSESSAPTPGGDAVPRFAVGSLVATNAPGLRVRSRPGTDQRVVTTLGLDAQLLVGLGPILVDELGWYLVRDADEADPEFAEGWVAAGFEPDPFLVSAGFPPDEGPYVGGFADAAPGEFGPVALPRGPVALRWIAATGPTDICNFALDLSAESGEPVRAVRTPVGAFPASGELPPEYFRANDLEGERVFVHVESNCSWAISFVRRVPDAAPS